MAVSKQCKQYLCLFYACILFVSGILLLVCSVYFGYRLFYHFKFVPSVYIAPIVLIFLLGFIHLLLTWLGINGPRTEHLFHIILFIIITIILILSEIGIGTWSMTLWNRVDSKSSILMMNSFERFLKDDYDKKNWVKLQSKLHCCGINNESDYTRNSLVSLSSSIPISCCNSTTLGTCGFIYQQGCKQPLIKYVKKTTLHVALVSFSSGIFQIVGIVAFCYLYKAIKQEVVARSAARQALRTREDNPLNRRNAAGGGLNQGVLGPAA